MLGVWVDIVASGVYSPALTSPLVGDGVLGLPSYLDDLAQKGYLAIRVPHAPPTYTVSILDPDPIEFRYYMPPSSSTAITVPIAITRVLAYEGTVNTLYPISDGHSHWEVWWIEDDHFPVPTDTFRLEEGWPQAIEVSFRIDFSDANAAECAGCPMEILLYNGYTFIGPFQAPLVMASSTPLPGNPLAAFDQGCATTKATYMQYITPTVPFSHTHWLGNYDTVTRTFTITATSSQNWAYTYYYGRVGQPFQPAPSLPFTVSVGHGAPGGWPPPCVGISAIHTPSIAITDTLRETFYIAATSTVSPDVQADVTSFAMAPGYQLDEAKFKLYLPLVLRTRN